MLEPHNIYHIHHRMYIFHYFKEKDPIASSRTLSANSPHILLHITQKGHESKSKPQPTKAVVPEDTRPVVPTLCCPPGSTEKSLCAPAGAQHSQSSWPGNTPQPLQWQKTFPSPAAGPTLLTGTQRALLCPPQHPKASGININRSETSPAWLMSTSENRIHWELSNLIWGLDTCPDIYGVWFKLSLLCHTLGWWWHKNLNLVYLSGSSSATWLLD